MRADCFMVQYCTGRTKLTGHCWQQLAHASRERHYAVGRGAGELPRASSNVQVGRGPALLGREKQEARVEKLAGERAWRGCADERDREFLY